MDRILEQSLLFDFYGELLNEHQRRIYEEVVMEDCSLGEVAASEGISRQGVHDIVKRCEKSMRSYEGKLHLVEKFCLVKEQVEIAEEAASGIEGDAGPRITGCLKRILEIL